MLAALGSEIVFPSLAPIYIEASCPSELPPYEPNVSSSNRFQNHIPSPDRRRDFFWNCFYAPAFIHSAAEKKKLLVFGFISELGSSWSSWQGKVWTKDQERKEGPASSEYIKQIVGVYEKWANGNIAALNIL